MRTRILNLISALGFTPVNKAGDVMAGSLGLPKTAGAGLKVESDYGWKDLIGDITPKTQGAGSPVLAVMQGHLRWYCYGVGDDCDVIYHMPHDYAPGTDVFLHFHWQHNGTNISGALSATAYASYAKGHRRGIFHAEKTLTMTESGLTIGNTPSLQHVITEAQFSTPGGSASMIDTNLLEPDGIIEMHFDVDSIPAITGGSGKPFILALDLHYQSTQVATKNKTPDFYT